MNHVNVTFAAVPTAWRTAANELMVEMETGRTIFPEKLSSCSSMAVGVNVVEAIVARSVNSLWSPSKVKEQSYTRY